MDEKISDQNEVKRDTATNQEDNSNNTNGRYIANGSTNGSTGSTNGSTSSMGSEENPDIQILSNLIEKICLENSAGCTRTLVARGGPNCKYDHNSRHSTISEATKRRLIEFLARNNADQATQFPDNFQTIHSDIGHQSSLDLIDSGDLLLTAEDIRMKICCFIKEGNNTDLHQLLMLYYTCDNFDEIINQYICDYDSPLYLAVSTGNLTAYEYLLSILQVNVLLPHRDWNTVYHILAERRQFNNLAIMLEYLERFPTRKTKTLSTLKTLLNKNGETVYNIVLRKLSEQPEEDITQFQVLNKIHQLLGQNTFSI